MVTHVLTGDLGGLVAETLTSPAGYRATAFVVPYGGAVTSGGDTMIGAEELTLDVNDAFTITLPEGGYRVDVRYFDPGLRQMADWSSGYFSLDANLDLATIVAEALQYEPFIPDLVARVTALEVALAALEVGGTGELLARVEALEAAVAGIDFSEGMVANTVDTGASYRIILFSDTTVKAIPVATPVPTTPTGLAATPRLSSVKLTWTAATLPTSGKTYVIYRNGSQIATTTALSYRDIAVAVGSTYTYQVLTRDIYGQRSSLTTGVSAYIDPALNVAPNMTVTAWPTTAPSNGRTLIRVCAADVNAQTLSLALSVDVGSLAPTDDPSIWYYTPA